MGTKICQKIKVLTIKQVKSNKFHSCLILLRNRFLWKLDFEYFFWNRSRIRFVAFSWQQKTDKKSSFCNKRGCIISRNPENLFKNNFFKNSTLNFLVSNRVLESVFFKNLALSVFAPGENTRGTFYQHSRPPSKILLLVLSGPVGPNDANLIFVRNSHAKCWKNKDNILQKILF